MTEAGGQGGATGEEMTISLFPLPDVVLFPGTALPLHIFEPRYRQMTADCLAGDRRIAMVLLRPGWEANYEGRPPIHSVAGAGEIVAHEALPDGRYNILLQGRCRIAIVEEVPSEKLYRIARVRILPDISPPGGVTHLQVRLQTLAASYLRLLQELRGSSAPEDALLTPDRDPGGLVDQIAAAVLEDPALRQQVLEIQEVEKRLEVVLTHLTGMILRVHGEGNGSRTARARMN